MSAHVRGPTYARKTHPRLDTKPTSVIDERRDSDGNVKLVHDTGGGYERIRSTEHRDHTSRQGSESVYASVHRLCAVAWCYPADMDTADVLEHIGTKDVHHESGVEWLNCHESPNLPQDEFGIEVLEHGTHSEITQSQMKAWAKDAKRATEGGASTAAPLASDDDHCDRCGTEASTLAKSEDWDGLYCVECAKAENDGARIRVV